MAAQPKVASRHTAASKQTEDYRLILMSPTTPQRHRVLADLVGSGKHVAFYTLPEPQTQLSVFLSGLLAVLREPYPDFGHRTEAALAQQKVTAYKAQPAHLAQSLIADLASVQPVPRRLFLDNADYLALGEDGHAFFRVLAEDLPRDFQVILNGRTFSHRFWAEFIQDARALVLADETLVSNLFSADHATLPHLEVYALGTGRVLGDGLPVTAWEGPLARGLFYYLLDHPLVTRDEIFEVFWPALNTKDATNVFHVTKRKVAEVLGYELTTYSMGFYRPSEASLKHYDVQVFEAVLMKARASTPAEARACYEQAIQVYRYPFLYTDDMPWIVERREQLKQNYVEALVSLARLCQAAGEEDLTLSYLQRAQREMPEREDLCRDVMALYQKQGQVGRAKAHYEALADRLMRKLRIPPSAPTREAYYALDGKAK